MLSQSAEVNTCLIMLNPGQRKGVDETKDCQFLMTVVSGEVGVSVTTGDGCREVSMGTGDWLIVPSESSYDLASLAKGKSGQMLVYIISRSV